MKPTKLELEIHGQNELKKLAKYTLTQLIPLLALYKDKKLFTSSGLTKVAQKDINLNLLLNDYKLTPLKNGYVSLHHPFLDFDYGSLKLTIKLCFNGGSYDDRTAYTQYFDQTFYIGKMLEKDSTFLKEVTVLDNLILSYELDNTIEIYEQINLISNWKELKEKLEVIERKIQIPKDVYKYM